MIFLYLHMFMVQSSRYLYYSAPYVLCMKHCMYYLYKEKKKVLNKTILWRRWKRPFNWIPAIREFVSEQKKKPHFMRSNIKRVIGSTRSTFDRQSRIRILQNKQHELLHSGKCSKQKKKNVNHNLKKKKK